jgi:predicted amidophosphoribosyltransferase
VAIPTQRDSHRRSPDPVLDVRAGVLVVDDVCTTGATLAAAAAALTKAGFTAVHGLVIARTPGRG